MQGPGAVEGVDRGGRREGNMVGLGEKAWGSQEEDGDGRAAVEGPGSSEDRKRVVDDCESKVLGSESVKEEEGKSHSGIWLISVASHTLGGREMSRNVELWLLPLRGTSSKGEWTPKLPVS